MRHNTKHDPKHKGIAVMLLLTVLAVAVCSAPALAEVGETVSLNCTVINHPTPEPAAPETWSGDPAPVGLMHMPSFPLTWPGAAVKLEDTPLYIRADKDSMQLALLQPGEMCYIVEPFADGVWHRVGCREGIGYIDTGALDTCDYPLEYAFDTRQSMLTVTGYSAAQLELCLSDGLAGMGECFAAAEREYGVNALFLIAICQEESASGTSALAVNRNNLAGLGGPGGWQYFDSYADCVDYLAGILHDRYLNADSSFFHGYSISGVSMTYCNGSAHWIGNIALYINRDLKAINGGE